MPYLCTQIDIEWRKQQRDRDARQICHSERETECGKRGCERETHTKDARKVRRCTIRGFSAQASRWNRSESGNTLSSELVLYSAVLSQAKALALTQLINRGNHPCLVMDDESIASCFLKSIYFRYIGGWAKKRNERQCICSQL